jgi:nucleotide-binding universal stress UspA family protein
MVSALFERILIATDGSEKNRAALDEALLIARTCNALVYAVYVIDARAIASAAGDIPLGDTYRMYQAEAEGALSRVRDRAGELKVETSVLEGNPAAEVVRFAAENSIDLIVIATQGKKGLERLLLGSVAEEIIRSAHCKVLVVK